MSKKKLITDSPSLRKKVKEGKVKKSELKGDALSYWNKYQGAKKARAAKKAKIARIEQLVIPRDSEMYRMIERAAKAKKMSVAAFIKKYRDAIEALMKDGDFVLERETEYLIDDLKKLGKGKAVFVNDGNGFRKTGAKKDIYNITAFTQHIAANSEIFLIVYRVHRKMNGDASHFLPDVEEYEGLEEEEDLMKMLDGFYPEITYLISKKKEAKPENIIEPNAPERKKGKKGKGQKGNSKKKAVGKSKSDHAKKR